jgi:hypothetical protein
MTEVRVCNAEARVIAMTEVRFSRAYRRAVLSLIAIIVIPSLLGLINQIKRVIVTYK